MESLSIYPQILSIAVPFLLALYGWLVITRIAKRREAYDLCMSIIALSERTEQMAADAWKEQEKRLDRHADLGQYTEKRLTTLISEIELRLDGFLHRYYHSTDISRKKIRYLRQLAIAPRELLGDIDSRELELHTEVSEIIADLLKANYEYMNRKRLVIM